MGTMRLTCGGIFIIIVHASHVACYTCAPGFDSDLITVEVPREQLRLGTRLGRVNFRDCGDRKSLFSTDDEHFMVRTDGTLVVKRQIVLHEGRHDFFIHFWDSHGHKLTVPVTVLHHDGHRLGNAEHRLSKVDSSSKTETDEHLPVIHFPKSGEGLRRRKRDWVIPPMSILENARGTFPQRFTQIRSNEDKIRSIYYSISGPGVDEPPIGLFIIDRDSGVLYVTQPLDREKQASYTFTVHAVAEGKVEEPMQVVLKVSDQNDNPPVFTKSTYLGEVAESSPVGHEVIQVEATDFDEPNNLNSIIRYSIVSQDPKDPRDRMFVINEVTGMIRLNAAGLDKEVHPRYALVVRAADGEGRWLSTEAKVLLNVIDSNDNAPTFTQTFYEATVADNKPDVFILRMLVTDGDEPYSPAWSTKFKIIDGDPGNLFTVETGPSKQEGILKTVKGLDFERSRQHTLLITVENEVPFAAALPTSTATVVVNYVPKHQDHAVGFDVQLTDPSAAPKVRFNIISDPAGWLNIADETITVKCLLNRDSHFVVDGKYSALIGVFADGAPTATGTSTLTIQLEDGNASAK